MENHPIPQDITGFQFKIIGNMTIRQFAYLCTGSILAWIFFSLPIFFVIKFFFVAFFFLLGVSLAFIPVSGRPLDAMISRFIKALFVPNQYVYQNTSGGPIQTLPQKPLPSPNNPPPKSPLSKEQAEADLQKETAILEKELQAAKSNEANKQQTPQKDEAHKKTVLLEQQLQEVLLQKQQLEQQLIELTRRLESKKPTAKPVQKIVSQTTKAASMPESPNIINGVVKDPRGNIISNILIEVKDQEGNPVRAFKTNSLGQFASATSLANGTYTLIFEDPRNIHKFKNIELVAKGEVIPPLTVTSTDPREELRKDLFGA